MKELMNWCKTADEGALNEEFSASRADCSLMAIALFNQATPGPPHRKPGYHAPGNFGYDHQ